MAVPIVNFNYLPVRNLTLLSFSEAISDEAEKVFCEFKKVLLSTGFCVITNHGISTHMVRFSLRDSVLESLISFIMNIFYGKAYYFSDLYLDHSSYYHCLFSTSSSRTY